MHCSNKTLRIAAFLYVLATVPLTCLAEELATVRLYYQQAEAVATRIRQLFPAEQLSVSGMQNQIILRAQDTRTLDEARAMIAALDQRPRQFRITLQNGVAKSSDMQGRQLTTRSTDVQTVTVMENTPVMIEQGLLRPVMTGAVVSPFGSGVTQKYQAVGNGMRVVPRMAGENEIEISVESAQAKPAGSDGSRVQTGSLTTTRLVRPGEWVDLGGTSSHTGSSQEGTIHYSTRKLSSENNIIVKVDVLD